MNTDSCASTKDSYDARADDTITMKNFLLEILLDKGRGNATESREKSIIFLRCGT